MSRGMAPIAMALVTLVVSCGPGESNARRDYPVPPAGSYDTVTMELTALSASSSRTGAAVSADFFAAAQAQPMLGRLFVPDDFTQAGAPVVMLHYDLWQKTFKGAPEIIGRTVSLDGKPRTIVGIMPAGFSQPKGAEFWIPRQ